MFCTSISHVYPAPHDRPPQLGTPCFCGQRTWGGAPRLSKRVRVGSRVRALGEERTVTEKVRGEDAYRVDSPVRGRALFERAELEVV